MHNEQGQYIREKKDRREIKEGRFYRCVSPWGGWGGGRFLTTAKIAIFVTNRIQHGPHINSYPYPLTRTEEWLCTYQLIFGTEQGWAFKESAMSSFYSAPLSALIVTEASLFQRGKGAEQWAPSYINAPAWLHTRISRENNSFWYPWNWRAIVLKQPYCLSLSFSVRQLQAVLSWRCCRRWRWSQIQRQ